MAEKKKNKKVNTKPQKTKSVAKKKSGAQKTVVIVAIVIAAVIAILLTAYIVGGVIYNQMYSGDGVTEINTDLTLLRDILIRDGEYTGSDFTPDQVATVMSGILLEQEETVMQRTKSYAGIYNALKDNINADLSPFLGEFSQTELDFCRKCFIYDVAFIVADYLEAEESWTDSTETTSPESTTEKETQKETETESETKKETADQPDINEIPDEVFHDENIYNVLLLGIDGTEFSGRSDSIILVSINKKTKRIVLTSFMRDLRVYDPNFGWCKINSVYARKGTYAESVGRLEVVLNQTYKMPVDNYALVDFEVFGKVIDVFGGVTVPMYYSEWAYMDRNTSGTNKIIDVESKYQNGKTYSPVNVKLNGTQALIYARMRKGVVIPTTGESFRADNRYRDERQRNVIISLLKELQSMDFNELCSTVKQLTKHVKTDIKYNEFLARMAEYMDYSSYTIDSFKVPLDGKWVTDPTTYQITALDNDEIAREWQAFVTKE